MRFQNVKLLTAMMLSGLISAVAVYPAFARPVGELGSDQLLSQTNQDSTNQNPMNRDSTNQTPINQDSTNQSPINQDGINQTGQAVTGEIVNIDGERVTIRQPNGQTRDIMVSQRDMQRLSLTPGMQIAAMLDGQNMASSVSLANTASENTTDSSRASTTLRREEEITQRRTVRTEPAPTSTQNTDVRPTTVTQSQEVEPQTEEPRPVRALW